MQKRMSLSFVMLLSGLFLHAQCPPEGNATDSKEMQLNRNKNRSVSVGRKIPEPVKLSTFLGGQRRNDENMFFEGAYVSTEGYLTVKPEEQGPETCNCQEASESKKDGDVHMFLGLQPDAPKKNCIVIEITPKS